MYGAGWGRFVVHDAGSAPAPRATEPGLTRVRAPRAGKQRRRVQSPQDLRGFDKAALAAAQARVNQATLPPDAGLRAAYTQFLSSLTWPGPQAFLPQFEKLAAEKGPEELELRSGHYLGIARHDSRCTPDCEDPFATSG